LLAGQGEFPLIIAEAASSLKQELILFGLKGYTDKRIETYAKEAHYIELGALEELIHDIKESRVKRMVLAGAVPKREIYNPESKMDTTAKDFIHQNKLKGDDQLLKAFQLYLKVKLGVDVIDSRLFLKETLATKGVLTKRLPTQSEWDDLKFGFKIAKGIGSMDIGQTVVVKDGVVLAIEALEGTDKAIERGTRLGRGNAVIVKVSKPNQDLRFDLPCIGMGTLESIKNGTSKVLGVESGKTLLLHKDQLLESANRDGITIVGL